MLIYGPKLACRQSSHKLYPSLPQSIDYPLVLSYIKAEPILSHVTFRFPYRLAVADLDTELFNEAGGLVFHHAVDVAVSDILVAVGYRSEDERHFHPLDDGQYVSGLSLSRDKAEISSCRDAELLSVEGVDTVNCFVISWCARWICSFSKPGSPQRNPFACV